MWSDTKEICPIIDIDHGDEGHHFHVFYIVWVVLGICDSIDHPTYAAPCNIDLCTDDILDCKPTIIYAKICYFVILISPLDIIVKRFHKMEPNLYPILEYFSRPSCKIYGTFSIQITIIFVCNPYRDIHIRALCYLESEATLCLFPPFTHLSHRRLEQQLIA